MAITTPSSDRKIYRITEYDLLNTNIKVGNLYMCTDSKKMYEDVTPTSRQLLNVVQITTEKKRLYDTTPTVGLNYYVWETNELWLWSNKWILIVGNNTYPVAYQYIDGDIYEIDANGVVGTNGLLDDGSVVVRDINRIIKGKIYIDETNDNLVVSSFLGGGMKFLANGLLDTAGTFDLSEDAIATYWGQFQTYGGEMYVSYKDAYTDPNPYQTPDHKYLVYHSGNMSAEHILDQLTGARVHTLLKDYNRTVNPLQLNVDKVDGYDASQLAKAIHTHVAEDITDFTSTVRSLVSTIATTGRQVGLNVAYDPNNNRLNYTANSFTLALSGGVTGSAVVSALSDTTINVTVDPSKHTHTIDIEEIIGGTELKNKVNVLETSKLDTTTFNAMLSTVPFADKILLMDSNGYLPTSITGNASTASRLATARTITLSGGVNGNVAFDGSSDVNMSVEVDPTQHEHTQYALQSNVGITIAQLIDGKVPISQLPDAVLGALNYQGTFNPNDGMPTATIKGQYWIATASATVGSMQIDQNDWAVYNGSGWDIIDNTVYVNSVNGRTGNIVITLQELGGISDVYLDYGGVIGIPANKLILTDSANHIPVTAASTDKLINPITMAITGDVEGTTNTDLSSNVSINVTMTQAKKQEIIDEIQAEVSNVYVGKYIGEYDAATEEGMIPRENTFYNNSDWYIVTSDFVRSKTSLPASNLRFDEVYAGDILRFIGLDHTAKEDVTKDMWYIDQSVSHGLKRLTTLRYIENETTPASGFITLDNYYLVGSNDLQFYVDGALQTIKTTIPSTGTVIGSYIEVGDEGTYSNKVMLYDWGIDYIPKGVELKFMSSSGANIVPPEGAYNILQDRSIGYNTSVYSINNSHTGFTQSVISTGLNGFYVDYNDNEYYYDNDYEGIYAPDVAINSSANLRKYLRINSNKYSKVDGLSFYNGTDGVYKINIGSVYEIHEYYTFNIGAFYKDYTININGSTTASGTNINNSNLNIYGNNSENFELIVTFDPTNGYSGNNVTMRTTGSFVSKDDLYEEFLNSATYNRQHYYSLDNPGNWTITSGSHTIEEISKYYKIMSQTNSSYCFNLYGTLLSNNYEAYNLYTRGSLSIPKGVVLYNTTEYSATNPNKTFTISNTNGQDLSSISTIFVSIQDASSNQIHGFSISGSSFSNNVYTTTRSLDVGFGYNYKVILRNGSSTGTILYTINDVQLLNSSSNTMSFTVNC